MAAKVVQIHNKQEHDEVVAHSKDIPTVIYVSNSSLPACKTFSPKYEDLAQRWSHSGIQFCQLEFTSETSMMFKFSPNQLPVTVFMVRDSWAKTVMGPDLREVEAALEELQKTAQTSA
ncbi:hypothetical protein DOTSEDRAFT_49073 [Dothistroma septosporum NZE10]|uniref:Thioredoxin domain-containing protein n=1 Tax=Dothistroma septosporum (strain NZE10 / CBS 128990) TaxID=675120 RepID=N1Q2G2_DOTSN|nr:hypothetical protein DOTSEDRAFT_49073 [Dothistroma septosporum NZE10]